MKNLFTRIINKLSLYQVINNANLTPDLLSIRNFSKSSYKYSESTTSTSEIIVLLAAIAEERRLAIGATMKISESLGRIRVHMKELEKKLSTMLGDREDARRDL